MAETGGRTDIPYEDVAANHRRRMDVSEHKHPAGSSAPEGGPPAEATVERSDERTAETPEAREHGATVRDVSVSGTATSVGAVSGSVILRHLLETTRSRELKQTIRELG